MSDLMEQSPIATRPETPNAMAAIANNREVAEAQGAILVAKKFPRDEKIAIDKIMTACQREGLAKEALYSYARGGTEISGPSIRLAEAIAQNWGNITFGIRELEQRFGESTVEAFAFDMETNTRQVKVFQVKHERYTKKGNYALSDPRDIYETVANQGARRLRACILGVVPGDIIEAAVAQCENTLKAKADTSPEALKKLVDAFLAFSVTREMVEKRIQRRLDSITPAQLISLRKVYNSLKDGMSTPAEWFDMVAEVDASATLTEKLKAKKAKPEAPPVAAGEPVEPEMCKMECPDRPDVIMTKKFCDACKGRLGCPSWQ